MSYDELTENQLAQVDRLFFTILDEITLTSFELTQAQIDYILEEYRVARQPSIGARYKVSPKEQEKIRQQVRKAIVAE